MSTTSPVSGLALPEQSDILNPEEVFGNYALGADTLLCPRFASTSERDTAFAAGVTEGMVCTLHEVPQMYDGTRWNMFQNQVNAAMLGSPVVVSSSTATNTGLMPTYPTAGVFLVDLMLFSNTATAAGGRGIVWGYSTLSGSPTLISRTLMGGAGVTDIANANLYLAQTNTTFSHTSSAQLPATTNSSVIWEQMLVETSGAAQQELQCAMNTTWAGTINVIAGTHYTVKRIA